MRARIANVVERYAGTELDVDAADTATELIVVDPDELEWQGERQLQIGTQIVGYTMADDGTVELDAPLDDAHVAGERVLISPAVPDRLAYLQAPEQDEALEAL